jgi:septum site-determining protein MinC
MESCPARSSLTLANPPANPGFVTENPQRSFIRVRGRSFIALVLSPELPLDSWLNALDEQMARSASFFEGRPVVVDLAAVPVQSASIPKFIEALQARDIRIIGVEGADEAWPGDDVWGRPPMAMTRVDRAIDIPEDAVPVVPEPELPSLVVDQPVRSGQSIIFPRGDLTVIGSVSSGAELIAGGSIHVYGTLRGRAIAGLATHGQARIFCRRMEAELLAIDGIYKSADDMDAALHGRPVQAWLQGDALLMAALG